MDGIHDMGGMHGFGPIEREENEPLFHHPVGKPGTRHIRSHTCADPRRLPQQHRKHGPRALPLVQLLRKMAILPYQRTDRCRCTNPGRDGNADGALPQQSQC